MAQVLQTNGDYLIKTGEGNDITLNTGPGVGRVLVTGNLVVEGDTLTVSAENLNVNDNIITLNYGESGAGVSLIYSGIKIDRGTELPASFVYDESFDTFQIVTGAEGAYGFTNSRIKTRYILTDPDTDSGDLTVINQGVGVIKVTGTQDYEEQITDDDDIPNKKYVDDAIRDNPTFQVLDDNTRVIVTDKNEGFFSALNPAYPITAPQNAGTSERYFFDNTGYTTNNESAISVLVDGTLIAQFFNNRLEIGNLEIGGGDSQTEITTKEGITNEDIILRTQGSGKVTINYALQLENIGVNPTYVSSAGLLHAGPVSIGTTGLYFVNDSLTDPVTSVNPSNPTNNDTRYQRGELISKNKALLFSMLF